jgi:phosphatidylinositol 4-kinase B
MAPFKLTQDYIDILGSRFNDFKQLLKQCFLEVRRYADRIIMIVELMQKGESGLKTLFRDHLLPLWT